MSLALHAIEIIENSYSAHTEVRALVATWATGRFTQYKIIEVEHAEHVGDFIRDYVHHWFGMLAADEESFPGAFLARMLSLIDWTDVGKYYLERYIEDREVSR